MNNGSKITVAVKVLFDMEGDEFENFKQEFSILNAIRHKNVVRLVGVSLKPKLGMVNFPNECNQTYLEGHGVLCQWQFVSLTKCLPFQLYLGIILLDGLGYLIRN